MMTARPGCSAFVAAVFAAHPLQVEAIAWAVGEYLHDAAKCKTLFATHYHELVDLARAKKYAANYHVAAKEYGDDVVFLRKLVEGGTSRSFGIQVARMAGLPEISTCRWRSRNIPYSPERTITSSARCPSASSQLA